jgi:phosphatidylglycerophosphate synthase
MRPAKSDSLAPASWIPNCLSLLRVGLACVFAMLLPGLFRHGQGFPIVITLFAAICLSDLLDGLLARKLSALSTIGAWVDLLSDLFYILLSLIVLNVLGQVPIWFTALVVVKFGEYLLTSHLLRSREPEKPPFHADLPGRWAASAIFFLPGIVCILHQIAGIEYRLLTSVLLYLISAAAVLSLFLRCLTCMRVLRKHSRNVRRV